MGKKTIKLQSTFLLDVSDDLLSRLKSGELSQFVLSNSFRNNSRILLNVDIIDEVSTEVNLTGEGRLTSLSDPLTH